MLRQGQLASERGTGAGGSGQVPHLTTMMSSVWVTIPRSLLTSLLPGHKPRLVLERRRRLALMGVASADGPKLA